MQRRILRRVGVVAAALALVAAGCSDDDDDAGTSGDDETPAEAEVTALDVTAVDYGFEGLPEEFAGGAVEIALTNDGEVDHEIAFVEIGDTELDQFFVDFAPVFEGGPSPEYMSNAVGANEAPPGEAATFTYTLAEGTYAVFCALTGDAEDPESEEEGAPHFELGMSQLVEVTAAEGATELPEADGTITAMDYSFETDLSGGDSVINFTNDGPDQWHFAGFDLFPEGTTVEEAEAAFETFLSLDEGEEPPEGTPETEEIGFSGIATAGNSIQFEVPGGFEAGRTYIFYCFISDLSGGPPHAIANQMYKAFTIE